MIRYLCILAVLSAPLYAQGGSPAPPAGSTGAAGTAGTTTTVNPGTGIGVVTTNPSTTAATTNSAAPGYFNYKSGGSAGDTYRVATVDIDGTSFKVYIEVTLATPVTSCAIMSFGNVLKYMLSDADVLAVTLNPAGNVAEIKDFIGDSGTYSVKKVADAQDWSFVSTAPTSPSYSYNAGTWKVEAKRAYAKSEGGKDYSVKKPGQSGWQPVTFAVFKGACPTGAFSWGTFDPVLSTWYADELRPTKSSFSAVAIFSWISAFVLMALFN